MMFNRRALLAVLSFVPAVLARVGDIDEHAKPPALERFLGKPAIQGGHDYQLLLVCRPPCNGQGCSGDLKPHNVFSNRKVIFVNCSGRSKIKLYSSGYDGTGLSSECDAAGVAAGEFGIIDYDGTDSDGASFCLPDPYASDQGCTDPDVMPSGPCDEEARYAIFARVNGPQSTGGKVDIGLCADIDTSVDYKDVGVGTCEPDTTLLDYCGATQTLDTSNKKFTDVSDELLNVCLCTCSGGNTVKEACYGLFDEALNNEYWQYDIWDGTQVKVAHLRFYFLDGTNYAATTRADGKCPELTYLRDNFSCLCP